MERHHTIDPQQRNVRRDLDPVIRHLGDGYDRRGEIEFPEPDDRPRRRDDQAPAHKWRQPLTTVLPNRCAATYDPTSATRLAQRRSGHSTAVVTAIAATPIRERMMNGLVARSGSVGAMV